MPLTLAAAYKSPSQRARVVTEAWGSHNLYCPRCDSPQVTASGANTKAVDFVCPRCAAAFQLKSQAHAFSRRITDAAYHVMRRAIEQGKIPHLLALHYDPVSWNVRNLTLIPSFALTLSCLEKRRPLALTARRKGWVGCNILLFNIPPDARITVVSDGIPAEPRFVRRQYNRLQPLEKIEYKARGWTLDVLQLVRSLQKQEFSLSEVYGRSVEVQRLYPNNLHVREKIRQQLQRLREMGLIEFLGSGRYLLRS
ncbi:MAG TPA: DpnI domain-containing protein [Terriglobia bacterium]|nr:DpnI domain-containing protein [Terriglobia bacterium]